MKGIKVPHTYIIIFLVVVFCAALTYIIPLGSYDVHEVRYEQNGRMRTRTVLDPQSFRYAIDEATGKPITGNAPIFGTADFDGKVGILNYVFEGMTSSGAIDIIIFIIIIGGAFGIMFQTGSIENGITTVVNKIKDKDMLLIPVLFILFSLGGATFGMGGEVPPFVMMVVPIVVALGYDAVVGVMITYCASQVGFATSWMNPFSLAVAQGVSGIPVLSGAPFRIFMWCFFTAFGILFTMLYAKRIKKNPEKSISYESDAFFHKENSKKDTATVKFTLGDSLVLITLLLTIVWVIWGVMVKGYFIPEIASQFFVMGIVSGIIGIIFKLNNMKLDDMATSFLQGVKDILSAALCVGMARGIMIVLGGADPTTPSVINTLLFAAGNLISSLPTFLSAWFMYVFQSFFNFFVPSGSGQAALTMPLMAPLSDMAGVSRQVAVLAFQLGDGFTNLIVPTSGAMIACIGVARIDYRNWIKFQVKFQGCLFLLGSIFVIVGVLIGYH